MNTILIDRAIVDRELNKYVGKPVHEMIIDEFIFPEIKIKLKEDDGRDKTYKIKFIDGTNKFECRYYTNYEGVYVAVGFKVEYVPKRKGLLYDLLRDQDLYAFDELYKILFSEVEMTNKFRNQIWKENVERLGDSAIALCYMIMTYQPEVVEHEPMQELTDNEETQQKEMPKKEHVIRPKPDGNKTYLFRDIVKYVSHKKQKNKHNITCECWGVRGHYRHYKTGKVAFIHEYEKGKKRNEVKPHDKTYIWK